MTGHLNPSIRSEWAPESPTHSTNIKRLLCARKSVSALETHSDHPPPSIPVLRELPGATADHGNLRLKTSGEGLDK